MYTQHPLHSEFFDMDTFIEENVSMLRNLYDQIKAYESDLDEAETATLISICVYADISSFEPPIGYTDENEEGICDLATNLVSLATLFSLEDKGLVRHKGRAEFELTPEGKSYRGR
ncbi:MAG: hypothetical protein HC888_00415 [Candidatus Competibacteraceae bacterium]|nr:hypothetical protein [Candidatus Competibacteraceae bacterium]